MTAPFSRRRLLATGSALVAATLAGACGGGGSSGGSTRTSLRFTWWGNDLRNRLTAQVIQKFQERHPAITIQAEPAEWNGYWDKLATQFAGGGAPDVFQHDESQIAAYASRGTLLDLSTQPALDLSTMDAKVLDTGKVGGTQVAVPVGIAIFSVATNPDLLKAAGVEPPADTTWTWDQLAETAAKVTAAVPDSYGLSGFGTSTAELVYWARQSGEAVFPQGDEKPLTAATVVRYYDYARQLVDAKAIPTPQVMVENTAKPIDASLFGTGKAAFHLLFHTQMQAFANATATELTLRRLPGIEAGKPQMANKASMYWAINARTKSAEAAATYVNFIVNDPDAAKILLIERGVPAIPTIQEQVAPLLDATGTTCLRFAQDMQAEVTTPPQVTPPSASKFSIEFTRLSQDVLFGRTAAADAAGQIVQLAAESNR